MDCDNLTKYLTVADFECVGIVAKHCDLSKLCLAAEEAKQFDLIPLFCYALVDEILENWNLQDADADFQKYKNLICGGTFEDCNGKLRELSPYPWNDFMSADETLNNQKNHLVDLYKMQRKSLRRTQRITIFMCDCGNAHLDCLLGATLWFLSILVFFYCVGYYSGSVISI